jgi:ectoine hydroxylase-related dioxygenase (phytanoyl-CoA dioxygenase family)
MTKQETEPVASCVDAIERDGFAILPEALDAEMVSELCTAVETVKEGTGVRSRDGVYAIRNLLHLVPGVKRALDSPIIKDLVEGALGTEAFLVGGLFFDKHPEANWKVPWHQDATITVREKADATGFGPWSMKAGIHHVQAPPHVLYALLSLRLHLDGCEENQGALRVIPGSHNFGRLPTDSIPQFTRGSFEVCCVPKGGLLAMKPLLLHSSPSSANGGHRRVIHLDFAARPLPAPLQWYETHRW